MPTIVLAGGTATQKIVCHRHRSPRRRRLCLVLGRYGRPSALGCDHHGELERRSPRRLPAPRLLDLLGTSDNSTNNLVFDGLLTQAMKAGSNAYYKSLDGAGLTADGAGGIVEIDAALKSFWDNYRLSPDTIWVSSDAGPRSRRRSWPATPTAPTASWSTWSRG
jgi:hypothetical protein